MAEDQCVILPYDPAIGPVIQANIMRQDTSYPTQFTSPGPKPRPVSVRLLVDTGSPWSAVSMKCAGAACLPVVEQRVCRNYSGQLILAAFSGQMILPDLGISEPWLLIEFPSVMAETSEYDGLLGRDLLRRCDFRINGPAETFSITPLPAVGR